MGSEETGKIWENIVKIAQADGRITFDESNLIRSILTSANDYDNFLKKAIADHEIDSEEKSQLIDLRAKILDNAYRQASNDQIITDDEYRIIEETLKILHKLETDEFEFENRQ